MSIASLPLPIRLVCTLVCMLVVMWIGQEMPALAVAAAIAGWAGVLVSLTYFAGVTPKADRLPLAGSMLKFLAIPSPGAAAPAQDRDRMLREAEDAIAPEPGEHEAVRIIREQILPLVRQSARSKNVLGAGRAWLGVVHGPRGVGRTTVAKTLRNLLIGSEAVQRTSEIDLTPSSNDMSNSDWIAEFEKALDGVSLLDNARWLSEQNAFTSKPNALAFLAALSDFSERYPGRLCVIVILNDEIDAQNTVCGNAFSSEAAKELLRPMTVIDLPCGPLDEGVLKKLVLNYFHGQGRTLDPAAAERIIGMLRRQKQEEGVQFPYAHAARKLSEDICFSLPQNHSEISLEDLRTFESR